MAKNGHPSLNKNLKVEYKFFVKFDKKILNFKSVSHEHIAIAHVVKTFS